MSSKTVIEVARRAAGISQYRLAQIARTQQSSVSEYESRRKSPTLDVVQRLVRAADHKLVVQPIVFFKKHEDPEIGTFFVPDRLWSVPIPQCFSRVRVLKYLLNKEDHPVWDLSDPVQRIAYYETALVLGNDDMMLDSIDGVLLLQAWPDMKLPDVVREAWQSVIDAATASQDGPPRDPGGLSALIAKEIGVQWPPPKPRKRRVRIRDWLEEDWPKD